MLKPLAPRPTASTRSRPTEPVLSAKPKRSIKPSAQISGFDGSAQAPRLEAGAPTDTTPRANARANVFGLQLGRVEVPKTLGEEIAADVMARLAALGYGIANKDIVALPWLSPEQEAALSDRAFVERRVTRAAIDGKPGAEQKLAELEAEGGPRTPRIIQARVALKAMIAAFCRFEAAVAEVKARPGFEGTPEEINAMAAISSAARCIVGGSMSVGQGMIRYILERPSETDLAGRRQHACCEALHDVTFAGRAGLAEILAKLPTDAPHAPETKLAVEKLTALLATLE